MQRRLSIVLALTAWLIVLPASAAPAPAAKGWRPAFWKTSWGIATPDGATAYVVGLGGEVEALDLATGKVRWTFAAGKPLALVGRRLAVQMAEKAKPNTLRIVLIDDKGKQVSQSHPVVFPEGVEVSADSMAFTSSAWSDGVNLYLVWTTGSSRGPRGGGGGRGGVRRTSAEGVAKVHLESGKVEMLASDKAPSPPAPKVSEEVVRAARLSSTIRGRGRGFGPGMKTVAASGKHVVSVGVQSNGEMKEAVLLRWELTTEKALPPIVLTKGKSLTAALSTDARTVLVRVREQVTEDESTASYRLYSTATGKEVGDFPEEDVMSTLTVLGERAFYIATGPALKTPAPKAGGPSAASRPRGLFALDVKTGKILWAHSLDGRQAREFLRGPGGRRGGPRP